jgi:hypothetical protein
VLVLAARNRQTLTYETLAKLIGVFPPPALAHLLGVIHRYCDQRGLPPLTSLVVSGRTGVPGPGFTAVEAGDVPAAREQVYALHWPAAPTPEDFAPSSVAVLATPEEAP